MATTISFQGDKEFLRVMEQAIKQAPNVAEKVIKNHTEKGKRKAQQLSPVDTWYMHDSIFTFYEPMAGFIHSPAAYSGYVEYGTRYMYAQPFMRPMMEWLQPKLKKDLTDAVKGVLR